MEKPLVRQLINECKFTSLSKNLKQQQQTILNLIT